MIVVDVETTGFNPWQHSIVSIGAVDFAEPKRQFYGECRVWDGAKVDKMALVVNGYTHEQVLDVERPTPAAVLADFINWVQVAEDQTIAGQNPQFDWSFLRATAKMNNLEWRPSRRLIDLHSLAFVALLRAGLPLPADADGRPSLASDRIMEIVGIPAEPKPHIAINGARFEAEAFGRLIYGRSILPEFEEFPVPDFLNR